MFVSYIFGVVFALFRLLFGLQDILREQYTPKTGCTKRCADSEIIKQTDAGNGCLIQVTENGKLPIQILVDRDQEFSMFVVAIVRHEEWITSGNFHLRFLRRVPVSDKRCATLIRDFPEPVKSSSDVGTSRAEEPGSPAAGAISVQDEEDEKKGADQSTGTTSTPLLAQTTSVEEFTDE